MSKIPNLLNSCFNIMSKIPNLLNSPRKTVLHRRRDRRPHRRHQHRLDLGGLRDLDVRTAAARGHRRGGKPLRAIGWHVGVRADAAAPVLLHLHVGDGPADHRHGS